MCEELTDVRMTPQRPIEGAVRTKTGAPELFSFGPELSAGAPELSRVMLKLFATVLECASNAPFLQKGLTANHLDHLSAT